VVTLLRVAGILLVIALLVIPAALSRRLTFSLRKMMMLACLFSVLFTISGLFISLQLQLPSGAVIAILCGVTFVVFLILSRFRNRANRSVNS
jgi:zinc transport system permease protein